MNSGHGVLRATAITASSAAMVALLGFLKNLLAAYYFGTSLGMDAYLLALVIPDMVVNLVMTGAFNFVPLFAEERVRSPEAAWRAASQMISYWVVLLGGVLALAFALMPLLTLLIAPGYAAAARAGVVENGRILLLLPASAGLSRILSLALYAEKRFLNISLAETAFQAASTLYLVAFSAWGIAALVWGMVFGGFVQLAVVLAGLAEHRRRLRFELAPRSPILRRMIRLTLPTYVGATTAQANGLVNRALASLLPVGAISSLQYGYLIVRAPFEAIANSLGRALFPYLSHQFAGNQRASAGRSVERAFAATAALFLPACAGIFVLAEPIVRLVFQRGSFGEGSVQLTAAALRIYAIGLLPMGLNALLHRAFHASQDTATPAKVGVIRVGVNALLALALVMPLGHRGIALATVGAEYVKMVLFLRGLAGLLGPGSVRAAWRSLLRVLAPAALMGGLVWAAAPWLASLRLPGWRVLPALAGLAALGALAYLAAFRALCRLEFSYYVGMIASELRALRGRLLRSRERAPGVLDSEPVPGAASSPGPGHLPPT
jgi:putative peptidoglycan lipid II flippase